MLMLVHGSGPVVLVWALLSSACGAAPLLSYSTETPPLVLAPVAASGVEDQRGRFREIFCAVNESRGVQLPDHRPCEDALMRLELEPPPTRQPVDLSRDSGEVTLVGVLGLGGSCMANFLKAPVTLPEYIARSGFKLTQIPVNGLSSSEENAGTIREALVSRQDLQRPGGLVLIGYSKGIVDILEALVSYPEARANVRAVVSVAGAVGGSPLADAAPDWLIRVFRLAPEADCDGGDLEALGSLKPSRRKRWLAEHPLPDDIRYYSLVTFPTPERISNGLESEYEKLSRVDPRNDSQLIFYDQIIPGSRLLGYLNADHLAVVLPIARSHPWIAEIGADQNDFPREVLVEAIARHVQEDLGDPSRR